MRIIDENLCKSLNSSGYFSFLEDEKPNQVDLIVDKNKKTKPVKLLASLIYTQTKTNNLYIKKKFNRKKFEILNVNTDYSHKLYNLLSRRNRDK